MRVGGLNALRKWIGEDERIIGSVMESEMMGKCVYILSRKTIESERSKDGITSSSSSSSSSSAEQKKEEEEEEEEEGVSVSEKNGILGIVLEVVEGGGWKGSYSELEEVVWRLEEEGEKEWRERKKGGREWNEWKEMGRLAHGVGWGIEKRKKMEGGGGGGQEYSVISIGSVKKEMAEEKRLREESEKRANEEKKRADEEKRMKEEEKRGREEEKRKREVAEREKKELEERLKRMNGEMEEKKKREEEERNRKEEEEKKKYRPITSLDRTSVIFPQTDNIKREGNTIIHHGPDYSCRNCFIGGVMTSF